jgi:hypothetical protein
MVREVLGDINLDPSSDAYGNSRVKADFYLDEVSDGLSSVWPENCTIFCNPPGGKVGNKSLAALFWAKLMEYYSQGKLRHAIYMGFSLEQLAVSQSYHGCKMADFPMVIPSQRIKFDAAPSAGIKMAPSHSNMIIYVPGMIDDTDKFFVVFSRLGACLNR